MRELNNLLQSDIEAFEKKGEQIGLKKNDAWLSYIKGLVQMAMADLRHTDREIECVCDEITERFYNDNPADILNWEWSHEYEHY